jgi:tetratricopeptide (TPR) repeat protein
MRGIDPRVVEVTAALPAGKSWASGYRLSPTLVLTARHVVVTGDSAAQDCALRPLGLETFVPATVAWFSSSLDLAVLRVAPDALPEVHAGSAPRWGRLEGRQSVPCRLTGFPVAHGRTDERGRLIRDPEPAEGALKLAVAAKREVIDVAITGSVPKAAVDSPWRGMSGAAVLCGPWLVAVVTSESANFGPDRLSATLTETALTDPLLLRLLAQENVSATVEVADLPRALQAPYQSSPHIVASGRPAGSRVRFLQPEFGIVPFTGRERELSDLAEWCRRDDRISACLVTGPGGQGKSRLALELCRQQAAEGWLSGMLADHADAAALEAMLAAEAPLLAVVDWADTKVEQITGLIERAVSAGSGPVRVLLLARHAGEWWEALPYRASGQTSDIFAVADSIPLKPLTGPSPVGAPGEDLHRDALAARSEQFRAAAAAFADHLGHAWQDIAQPDLSDRLFENLLFVHLAALLAIEPSLEGAPSQIGPDLLAEVLRREDAYYWEPTAPPALRGETARTTRHRAIAVATLTAARTEDEARMALQVLPDFAVADPTPAMYWLHQLYPAEAYFGPLRPDLLGEALVAQVIRARTDLPVLLLPDAGKAWATRLFTVLAQAAATDAALIASLNDALVSKLGDLVAEAQLASDASLGHALALALQRAGSIESAEALVGKLPPSSLAVAELGVATFQLLLSHDHSPETELNLRGNLAHWLAQLGRSDEAIEMGYGAVAQARTLALTGAGPDRTMLAVLLVNLGDSLGHADRYEDALLATDEALTIFRQDLDPAPASQEYLAVALMNRARYLDFLGEEREATSALEEAVPILRRLAEVDASYRGRLAGLLEQLSEIHRKWRREAEAVATMTEALEIYRELTASNPDAYAIYLAGALVNASGLYWSQGMSADALSLAEEAVARCRGLAQVNPGRYQPWLAIALDTRADCATATHGPLAALPGREEVVAIYRDLVQDAEDYRPRLARALTSLAGCLANLGQTDRALATIGEATEFFRQAEATTAEADPSFAKALTWQSQILDALSRTADALDSIGKAARIYRVLVSARPATYHADLTDSLASQSRLLIKAGRPADAFLVIEEAVNLPRSLASEQPKAFWSLFRALLEKAEQLERAGRGDEAQLVREDAGHIKLPAGMMITLPKPPTAAQESPAE